jgi:predicted lactoylglutathione lyase
MSRCGRPAARRSIVRATSRAQVDRFHAEGLKAGGRDNGRPGLRTDYGPNYYAAFLIDPDGNNVEAVWME